MDSSSSNEMILRRLIIVEINMGMIIVDMIAGNNEQLNQIICTYYESIKYLMRR